MADMPQSNIVDQLLEDIKLMQQNDVRIDVQPLKEQIKSFNLKKRKAIDLMIDGLITKEDLKKLTEYYDDEILKLTEQIAKSQDINTAHKQQLDRIKSYITDVKKTASSDSESTEVYGELLKKNEGIDVATVSSALGHSAISTTTSIYLHAFQDANARASEAIANVLDFSKKETPPPDLNRTIKNVQ